MKKLFKRILLPLFLVLALVGTVSVLAMAANNEALPDAMVDILADEELSKHKFGTYALADDGYLGIPVDFTFYHDDSFEVNNSYNGTALIMYVVNTRTERVGTDSDVDIIKSMLARGYVVAVADYHNHEKAVNTDIEWSTQTVNRSLLAGSFFSSAPYKSGFQEKFIVPAGHNIEIGRVFWEFDKHSTDGTLEKIVDIWNVDFRGMKGDKAIIPWHNNGVRKEAQNGIHDDSEPVWYSIGTGEGQVTVNGVTYHPDPENGLYLYIKHTKANVITDCVKLDGSPIELSLYMHIIYPTNPTESVPTLTLASSSEHLASGCSSAGRPHTYGFAFDGYAIAMYDFAYVPMARTDHYGYFDGSSMDKGSITGDNFTYNLFTYNSALVPTAAMRYLRYIAQTESETFKLNGTIGVIGNSKGSMITHLADLELGYTKSTADGYTEAELIAYADNYINSFGNYYYHDGHSGETRFDMGYATYTKDGFTVDGGERQPWLTLDGKMIPSNAQFVYSSCGGMSGDIDDNYGPFMTSAYYGDETSAFGGNGQLISLAEVHDIPFLYYTLLLGHTFLQRESLELGVDPYVGYKQFAHYFLRGDAPTVLYVTPLASGEITLTPSFVVKFAGIVSEEEIAKATLTDKNGNVILGAWESRHGNTEWTFTPSLPLAGASEYTLTVPTTLVAENGKALQESYTAKYYTKGGEHTTLSSTATTITDSNGMTLTLTVPNMNSYTAQAYNRMLLDVFVSSDAANMLRLTQNDANGALIDELPIRGAGHYALDLTDYLGACTPGTTVTVYLSAAKKSGTFAPEAAKLTTEDFEDGVHEFKKNSYSSIELTEMEGHGKVLAVRMLPKASEYYPDHKFYPASSAISYASFAMSSVTESDYGRRFTITFEVYDTTSRMIRVTFGNVMSEANGVIDYDVQTKNFTTKAGEWTTITVEFDNYGREYGKSAYNKNKSLTITAEPTGENQLPLYFDNFTLTETVTDIEVGTVSLSLTAEGGSAYKYAQGTLPFLVDGTAYATLADAIKALDKNDGVITLQSNVTLTEGQSLTNVYAKNITLDLNGYTIRTNVINSSVISVNTEQVKTITVKNGSIYLSGGSLIGFESSKLATNVDVALENVFIGTEPQAMVKEVLINTSASFTSKVRLTLTDCTVDMRESGFAKNMGIVMLPTSSSKVTVSLTMAGGSVLMSRTDSTMFSESMMDVYLKESANGMTVIYLSAARDIGAISVLTEKGFANITRDDTIAAKAGYYAYVATIAEGLSTPYGIIPEQYADVEKYPFVVFDRKSYSFLGAADILLQDSGSGAINTVYKQTGEYAIYLRRDFTHDVAAYNICWVNGDILIDLGGHTLTYNRGISVQAKMANYDCRITFTGGTLCANTTAAFLSAQGVTQTQSFSFTFDKVTFSVAAGKKPSVWISATQTSTSEKAKEFTYDITVRDCTFDMTNVTSSITLLKIGHPTGLITEKATLSGGHIIGNPDNLNLVSRSATEKCEFVFTKGSNGHYLTNTRLTSSAVPSTVINTADGPQIFNEALSTNGDYTTYGLGNDPLLTPYGRIPAEYAADPDTYAMLLFNTQTGAVIWAGNQWGGETKADGSSVGGILEAMKNNCSKGSLAIYFQADVVSSIIYFNHGNTTGTHTIDLNGHKLTLQTTMFQAQAKNKKENSLANFTIKNGTINVGYSLLLSIGSNSYDGNYGMTSNYVFENIKFENIGAETNMISDGLGGNFTTTTNIIFRNCDFHFNAGRSGALFTLGTKSTSGNFTVNITIEGGTIVTGDGKIPTFLTVQNGLTNKTLSFQKGTSGYTTVTTKKCSTYTDNIMYHTNAGDRYLVLDQTTDTQSIYTFGIKTAYGIIPATYENVTEHPFLIFNLDTGKFVKSTKIYQDETVNSALGYVRITSGNFVILLQCDFTTASSTDFNFGAMSGDLIFDLGGHTLTLSSALYHAQAKSNSKMNVLTKNGTVVYKSGAVVGLGSTFRSTSKLMNLTFENVTFRSTNAGAALVSDTSSGGYMTADLVFNGCTFISSVGSQVSFFKLGTYPTASEIHITINGGEFTLNSSNLPIFEIADATANHTGGIAPEAHTHS